MEDRYYKELRDDNKRVIHFSVVEETESQKAMNCKDAKELKEPMIKLKSVQDENVEERRKQIEDELLKDAA